MNLTRREKEFAQLYLTGLKIREASEKMGISEATGKTYSTALLQKTHCKTTMLACIKLKEQGLLEEVAR